MERFTWDQLKQQAKSPNHGNLSGSSRVKSLVRSVLAIFAIALGGAAMAQTNLTDLQCRQTLEVAFKGLRVPDPAHLTAYSYVLRLDTTEVLNGKTTTYAGGLRIYDDSDMSNELIKSELTLFRGTNLIQRTVADGRRVWSYDPYQNAYSANAYNTDQGPNTADYRPKFISTFKETAAGAPLNLLTLMDQASINGTARVKDWLGGIPFQGQNSVIPNDPLNQNQDPLPHQFNTIWQKVPDSSRFVQFNTETFDAGTSWILNSIQVHRQDKVGASTKVSDTYLTIPKDANNLPMTEPRNSAAFVFIPPARSKVLSSPRTVKF